MGTTTAAEVEVGACVSTAVDVDSGAKVAAADELVLVEVVVVLAGDADEAGEEPDPEPAQTAGPGILYSVKAWYRLKTMPGSE